VHVRGLLLPLHLTPLWPSILAVNNIPQKQLFRTKKTLFRIFCFVFFFGGGGGFVSGAFFYFILK
jgi:hypothetical protein